MKTSPILNAIAQHVGRVSILAGLAALTGCAHAPLRRNTDSASTITAPVPTYTVAPSYPHWLRRAGLEGAVSFRCLIDEQGGIRNARVLDSSHDQFASAALAALNQWKFAPGTRDGQPTPMHVVIPFEFLLDPDAFDIR